MTIDWEKLSVFVQAVGVPFAILLLFVGPFVYLTYTLINKYGSSLAEAHINFMESAEKTQEKNAETLSRLEITIQQKHIDHKNTHHAIGLVAQAGISILEDDKKGARIKLERVGHVLSLRGDDNQ